MLCEAPCAAPDVAELFSKTWSLPRHSHRPNVDENFIVIEREMVVQQDNAEELLSLMLDEHLPDGRVRRAISAGFKLLPASAMFGKEL